MKKDKLALRVEVEAALESKPMSEVNHCIRMQKFVLFLYKESTIFWTFFLIMTASFMYALAKHGPTTGTMSLGVIEVILYLPFYHFCIKKIKPFNNRASEYEEIKAKLDALIDYRDYRLSQ